MTMIEVQITRLNGNVVASAEADGPDNAAFAAQTMLEEAQNDPNLFGYYEKHRITFRDSDNQRTLLVRVI